MFVKVYSSGDPPQIITHRYHIDDFQKGFDVMEAAQCGKVILSWD
jgi:threonine 3-dehydrogenase